MSLGVSFKVLKAPGISSQFSLPCGCVSRSKLSATASISHLSACCHAPGHDGHKL